MVTLEQFQELEIRIGTVVRVERVPSSDRLLKFTFDLGDGQREILGGMADFFPDPSVLVGKQMPVLANLEPKRLRGEISHGMILAADAAGRPVLLCPEKEVEPGSPVR